MATWEDGPEYAPIERPSSFAAPASVAALDKAPAREAPSAEAPLIEPAFDQHAELVPLAEHHPELGPQRDPWEPYEVASSLMTETDSAWNTVGHYHVEPGQWAPPTGAPAHGPAFPDPRAPIIVAGSPAPPGLAPIAPQPASGIAPAPGIQPNAGMHANAGIRPNTGIQHSATNPEWLPPGPVEEQEARPTFGQVFNAVTAPTFITLLLGGLAMAVPLFGWLSPLMFVLAFLTSGRIAYRRHWVRLAFLVGIGALGTTVIVGLLFSPVDLVAYFTLVQAVSTVSCWLVLFAVLGIVWQALAAGEQPEYPDSRRTGWS